MTTSPIARYLEEVGATIGLAEMDSISKKIERNGLMYSLNEPPLTLRLKNIFRTNTQIVKKNLRPEQKLIDSIIDRQYRIASYYYLSLTPRAGIDTGPMSSLLFSCFHKNLISFVGTIVLTQQGLYGPARPLLRQSFEALMIAKYCSLNGSHELYNKWAQGEKSIFLTSDVLRNISDPDHSIFDDFWKMMCEYSHATIFSQQVSFSPPDMIVQSKLNYDLTLILLECNYHVLSILLPINA